MSNASSDTTHPWGLPGRVGKKPNNAERMRHGRRFLFCVNCEAGDHSRDHGPLGCTALVETAKDHDHVCRCMKGRAA